MFDLKTTLNSFGIALTLIGVYVVYISSPFNEFVIDGGGPDTNFLATEQLATRKNRRMRLGVRLVLAGSIAQLASNYIPSGRSC